MGMFGPSKNEIWQALSEEIRGTYEDGGFWKGSRVEGRHGSWLITLDTYTQNAGQTSITYTRMRAPFVNPSGFRFKIYKQGFFAELGKAFGGQDIEVGDSEFDGAYVIKGNDEDRVRQLFMNERIRYLIAAQPRVSMEIRADEGMLGPKFQEDENELYFLVPDVIKDIQRLKLLFDLFGEVLDTLVKTGIASDTAPSVQLFKENQ